MQYITCGAHNITKQLDDGFFPKKEVAFKKNFECIVVENSTIHSLIAPHK